VHELFIFAVHDACDVRGEVACENPPLSIWLRNSRAEMATSIAFSGNVERLRRVFLKSPKKQLQEGVHIPRRLRRGLHMCSLVGRERIAGHDRLVEEYNAGIIVPSYISVSTAKLLKGDQGPTMRVVASEDCPAFGFVYIARA
jgi:hypothetical protein